MVPYLSLCLQNLSPIPTSLGFGAKAETETIREIHKG